MNAEAYRELARMLYYASIGGVVGIGVKDGSIELHRREAERGDKSSVSGKTGDGTS